VHSNVENCDFDLNTYEDKLHVLISARRNQLRAEILSVNLLSDVQEELDNIEDLLRPWM
jgi:predicted DNA-binding protein YlxM (UPF0122 family)